MNIHYAFSIRSDGGDNDSDDDDKDVDKDGDNAGDDGEHENLFFLFQGSQRGRGQRSNITGYLVLEIKTDAEKRKYQRRLHGTYMVRSGSVKNLHDQIL